MTAVVNQPNLIEGLSLIGWRLKRDAEIREHKDEANFECEVEPSATSYAAFEFMSTTDDDYDPYANLNIDLCLEVDAIDLNATSQKTNDDYDPYEVFMRMNTRRTVNERDRSSVTLTSSQSTTNTTLVNNYRHYNFADDDTPVKYPLAIGLVDRRLKQQNVRDSYISRPSFESRGVISSSSSYRQPSSIIPHQNSSSSYTGIRRPIPPRQYPLNSTSKRVTFRQSDDELDFDEEDEDNLENNLRHRNKLPHRAAAQIAVQRFRTNNHPSLLLNDDLDDDIAPSVTEMDMLEDEEEVDESNTQTSSKSLSSPVKLSNRPTGNKSSYIGNMLPSFYEQLPESKKILLQDATIDSSSTQTDRLTKNPAEITTLPKKLSLTTEHVEGPGGEEVIDEDNRLQFHNTASTQGYKRTNNLQGTKRYYDNEEHQIRKHSRTNEEDYINRNSQYSSRRYEPDEGYNINRNTQEEEYQQTIRVPARRGRPPSQHQEDPSKKYARIISQFEEQHGLKLGAIRVFAPKLRLRISSVNVNWINLPPIPKFPNKVHDS